MRTDPITDHAALVLARMRIQKEDEERERVALRLTVAADRAVWPANKTYQEA